MAIIGIYKQRGSSKLLSILVLTYSLLNFYKLKVEDEGGWLGCDGNKEEERNQVKQNLKF